MPKLLFQDGSFKREVNLESKPVICGRQASCDIVIPGSSASREHCKFTLENGEWHVVDLNSSNGTIVNGKKITEKQKLHDGDMIKISDTVIGFTNEVSQEKPMQTAMTLKAKGGPADGQIFAIGKKVTKIGRSPQNDIALNDNSVSGKHAEIIVEGGKAQLTDLESRNGLHVNGAKMKIRDLENGDVILIGATELHFSNGAAADAGQTVTATAHPGDTSGEINHSFLDRFLTKRVKIALAVFVPLILILFVASMMNSEKPAAFYADNLLTKNPSFETKEKLEGWECTRGTAKIEPAGFDGMQCLRLSGSLAGDISAICWSESVAVAPENKYEITSFVNNTGGESATFCVRWSSPDMKWVQLIEIGKLTDNAIEWREVKEEFIPPSWAKSAQFGCMLIGQGSSKFDGVVLREVSEKIARKNLSAGRMKLEMNRHGEWNISDGQKMLISRGRAAVNFAGRSATQTIGTVEQGWPKASLDKVEVQGMIGLDGKIHYTESVATDKGIAEIKYSINLDGQLEKVPSIEFMSELPLIKDGVTLEDARGASSTEAASFEGKANISQITFGKGASRIFLHIYPPATVSVSGDGPVTWHFDFAAADAAAGFTLKFDSLNDAKSRELAAELQKAAKAKTDGNLVEAVKLYEDFIAKNKLYKPEIAEATRQLKAAKEELEGITASAEAASKRAIESGADEDFESAEKVIEGLLPKVKGDVSEKPIRDILAKVRTQRQAARQKIISDRAQALLDEAKQEKARGENKFARIHLQDIIKQFPNTKFAEEAKQILDTIPAE